MLFLSLKPTIPVKEEVKQPTHIAKPLVEKDMGSEKVHVKLNSEVNSESLKCQELKTEKKSESAVESAEDAGSEVDNNLDLSTNLTPQIIKRVHELYEKLVREQVKAVEVMENAAKKKGKIPKKPEEPYKGI